MCEEDLKRIVFSNGSVVLAPYHPLTHTCEQRSRFLGFINVLNRYSRKDPDYAANVVGFLNSLIGYVKADETLTEPLFIWSQNRMIISTRHPYWMSNNGGYFYQEFVEDHLLTVHPKVIGVYVRFIKEIFEWDINATDVDSVDDTDATFTKTLHIGLGVINSLLFELGGFCVSFDPGESVAELCERV